MSKTLNILLGLALALLPLSVLSLAGAGAEGFGDSLTAGFLLTVAVAGLAAFAALVRQDRYPPGLLSILAPYALFLVLVGTVLAVRLATDVLPLRTLEHASFDIGSYAIVLATLTMLGIAIRRDVIRTGEIIRYFLFFYLVSNAAMLTMFFVLGPTPLLSYNALTYSPLARNLHHTSLTGHVAFSLAAICLLFDIKVLPRLLLWAALATGMAAAWFSGSSKATAGIGLFLSGMAALVLFNRSRGVRLQSVALTKLVTTGYIVGIVSLVLALSFGVDVIAQATSQFAEVDYRQGRSQIYQVGAERFLERPIFGYGPGRHIQTPIGWRDTHSTPLTLLVQGGAIGFVVVVIAMARWLSRLPANMPVLIYLFAFLFYINFGDMFRSLPFWTGLLLVTDQAVRLGTRFGGSAERDEAFRHTRDDSKSLRQRD